MWQEALPEARGLARWERAAVDLTYSTSPTRVVLDSVQAPAVVPATSTRWPAWEAHRDFWRTTDLTTRPQEGRWSMAERSWPTLPANSGFPLLHVVRAVGRGRL